MEYSEQTWMEILRPGVWNGFDITIDTLKELVASYDPTVLRAPIVLDHSQSGPAYGHVLDLQIRDEQTDTGDFSLWAYVGLLPSGVVAVASGSYNERSVYIRDDFPFKGINYLVHLSLLGAANPAVVGMGPVILFPDTAEPDVEEKPAENAPFKLPDPGEGIPAYAEFTAAMFSAKRFIWDQTDQYVRYRVRPPSRFRQNSFRTVDISADKGLKSVMGKLKPEYVPEKANPDSMVIQAILFDRAKWDLPKAKEWVTKNKGRLSQIETETGIKFNRKEGRTMGDNENVDPGMKAIADENASLKERLSAMEAQNLKIVAEADRVAVNSRVEAMLTAGKLLPAHREMKIAEAIACIPADAKVGDKSARDIIFAAFEHGMAPVKSLKQESGNGSSGKTETGGDEGDDETGVPGDLKKLSETPKVDQRSVRVATRARELRQRDKSGNPGLDAATAYARAEAEVK